MNSFSRTVSFPHRVSPTVMTSCHLQLLSGDLGHHVKGEAVVYIDSYFHVSLLLVGKRSGLEGLEVLLRRNRLRWFGHRRRREEGHILRRALNFEVEGRRPPGRPKKTRRKVVDKDMRMLNITEEMAMNRQQWRRLISHPTSLLGVNGR